MRSSDHLIHALLEAPDYPRALGDKLAESKRLGLDFEEAWRLALEAHPAPYGYGSRRSSSAGTGSRPHGIESPLAFIRRHFKAAYEGREAARYCYEDCDRLRAPGSMRCSIHDALHEEAMRGAAAYPSVRVA